MANNKKDDGESFHERVRKGWESRKLPERAECFSNANSWEDNDGQALKSAGIGAHLRAIPDLVKKDENKSVETENLYEYTFPGSERTYEVFGEYESDGGRFPDMEYQEIEEMSEPDKKEILDAKRKLKTIATKQYPGIILGARSLGVFGNLGIDIYLNDKINQVTENKNYIKEMAEKHGVPAEIIGGIIFKEQLTQSSPDYLVYKWHQKDGSDHSTGLGAIHISAAKDAWNIYDSSKLAGMDDSAIMHKLMTDDKFNIETIALVLINKAIISGEITAYSEARELSYEEWSDPITLYNGSAEYTKKVVEYLPYINILLQ